VTGTEKPNPYAVPLEDVVDAVRVPLNDQTTAQPAAPVDAPGWDERRRQDILAGGA
jgi:hypothetical protein